MNIAFRSKNPKQFKNDLKNIERKYELSQLIVQLYFEQWLLFSICKMNKNRFFLNWLRSCVDCQINYESTNHAQLICLNVLYVRVDLCVECVRQMYGAACNGKCSQRIHTKHKQNIQTFQLSGICR